MDLRRSSPSSDVFSDDVDSVSIRDKTLLKRSSSKHNNNNFKAGYVPVHEQDLNKMGLRGRKTFAFWSLVTLLFILAIGNLILTFVILGVLRLGQGMQSIELVPEEYAIKFFGDTDLGYIYKRDGKIQGFKHDPVEITAEDSAILVNLTIKNGRPATKLCIDKTGTFFQGIESFSVKDKEGTTFFSTSEPEFNIQKTVHTFNSKVVETNRIVSPVNHKLKIETRNIYLKGSEGTNIDGKEIIWNADQDIYLKTINANSSIILNSSTGTYIDVRRIPIVTLKHTNFVSSQYKICVCMPQGKLFRIPVPSGLNSKAYCNHINMSPQHNPCM